MAINIITCRKFIYRFYKNKTEESPGWNDNILEWCLQEARQKQLREGDYWGGFVLDEMKIQVISKWQMKFTYLLYRCYSLDVYPSPLRVISIKILLVISMLCKTERWWELQTWSQKMNLFDILSPHSSVASVRTELRETLMRIEILTLGFKGLRYTRV